MNNLKLVFVEKPYPYPDEPRDPNIRWAEITLMVTKDELILKTIFKLEWDILKLLEWLHSNQQTILVEECPIPNISNVSIAELIYHFYDTDEELDDDADALYEYRSCHGLRFGLRGTDIDNVYVGRNKNTYEVSYFSEEESWCYEVDMIRFYEGRFK